MLTHRSKAVGRIVATLAVALALSTIAPVKQASAQGLFEALFGGFQRRAPLPPRVSSFADPLGMFGDERRERRSSGEYAGAGSGYCVRTCDGRFFPLKSGGTMSTAELCKSFCPASTTKIFSGSKIDTAVAADGTRYADLDNAFVYRERIVDNCTCNGKDTFGLAPITAAADPTLKPGDIVATNDGLATYNGHRNRSKTAEFSPIDQTLASSEWRRRLMAIKVAPAAPRAEVTPAPVAEPPPRADRRRVQR